MAARRRAGKATLKATGGTTMRHYDGDGWHDDGDGRHDDADESDGRHNDGNVQQDNMRHDDGNRWHDDAAR